MSKWLIILAAAALAPANAAAGQQATPPPPATAPDSAADAAHRAAAERLVSFLMPSGMMRQILSGSFPAMDRMMDMRIGDFGPPPEGSNVDPNLTFAEFMTLRDPHYRERTRIMSEVVQRVVGEVIGDLEPEFRSAMADIYAARFTTAELEEAGRFFATGTGRRFALMAPTLMQDPAFQRIMGTMTSNMATATPRLLQEIAAATAHLPPAPDETGPSGVEP